MAQIVGRQVLIMTILMAVGVICAKTKLVGHQGSKDLAGVLLYIVNPFLVLLSFQQEYSATILRNFLMAFAVSALVIGISTIASVLITVRKQKNWEIERYAYIFRNVGFFGIPIVSSVLGAEGVLYLSAFIAVFNIWNWSYGVTFMKGGSDKSGIREMLKNMINPTIIATIIGFILFVGQISLPSILSDSFWYVANMNTPIAMILAGVVLAESSISDIIKDKRCFRVTAVILVAFPLLLILFVRLLPIARTIQIVVSIALACPAATTLNMFSLRFDKDAAYAARINSVSTLLSAITIPLLMLLY